MRLGVRVVLEVGEDHRAARVGRDDRADVHRKREDALAQDLQRRGVARNFDGHERLDAHRLAVRFHCLHVRRGEREHARRHHAGNLRDAVGQAANPRERVRVHHIARAHAHRDDRGLVRAEPLGEAIVDLRVRMPRRHLVGEAHLEAQVAQLARERERKQEDDPHYPTRMSRDEPRDPIHGQDIPSR